MNIYPGEMAGTRIKTPASRTRRRRWRGLLTAVAVFFAGVGGFLYWRDLPPQITIPPAPDPSPNARILLQQVADLERSHAVDVAIETHHYGSFPGDRDYSPAEKAAMLRDDQPAVHALVVALRYPFAPPSARSFAVPIDGFRKYRQSSYLLVLAAQVHEARGDWRGAARYDLDNIALSAKVMEHAPTIYALVGFAIASMGQHQLWKDLPQLTAADASAAARRLQEITDHGVSYSDVLQEEEWSQQSELEQSFRSRQWRNGLLEIIPAFQYHDSDNESFGAWCRFEITRARLWLSVQPLSKRQVIKNYTTGMDRLIAQSRAGHWSHAGAATPTGNLLSDSLVSLAQLPGFYFARNAAQDALLTATLAVRAYTLDHGHPPARLEDLVPGTLSHVPLDPFSGAALRYKTDGHQYQIYSIGPDGKDNGGTPVPNPATGSRLTQESQGDIVAGVNL